MFFVVAAIALDLAAAIYYAVLHDGPRSVYWLAAAVIAAATLMIK